MGLKLFASREFRSWTVNTVEIPDGIDDATVRGKLLRRHGIEIVGGLGNLAGKVWRVGLMGSSSLERNVLLFLSALEEILAEEGYQGPRGDAVTAATAFYRER